MEYWRNVFLLVLKNINAANIGNNLRSPASKTIKAESEYFDLFIKNTAKATKKNISKSVLPRSIPSNTDGDKSDKIIAKIVKLGAFGRTRQTPHKKRIINKIPIGTVSLSSMPKK